MGDFIDDAGGDPGDEVVGEARPVGGHEVVGGDGAQGDRVSAGCKKSEKMQPICSQEKDNIPGSD